MHLIDESIAIELLSELILMNSKQVMNIVLWVQKLYLHWEQHEVNVPCGSGSVDNAVDSHLTNASAAHFKSERSTFGVAVKRAKAVV